MTSKPLQKQTAKINMP